MSVVPPSWGWNVEFFWIVTPCGVAVTFRRFGGPCCLLPLHSPFLGSLLHWSVRHCTPSRTPCPISVSIYTPNSFHPEDGGSDVLRHVIPWRHYSASKPRQHRLESSTDSVHCAQRKALYSFGYDLTTFYMRSVNVFCVRNGYRFNCFTTISVKSSAKCYTTVLFLVIVTLLMPRCGLNCSVVTFVKSCSWLPVL
jgi:hypothetical protein